MIREKKNPHIPASLTTTKRYDGEDVKKQLLEDQHEKCYICERKLVTDFVIEHLKSQSNHPELVREWTNLFLACSYCNGKKSASFDNNVNPLTSNVEEEIGQRIDFDQNKAVFTSSVKDEQHDNTVRMLDLLYNGNDNKDNRKPLRFSKEELFFKYAKQKVISFLRIINEYMESPTDDNKRIVTEELSIDKELLGFKYWIIRDNHLDSDFQNNIIWNK